MKILKKEIAKQPSSRLIFLDESGANLSLCRDYARILGGQRIKLPKPHSRGNYFSVIGAVGLTEVKAALYGQWATNGDIFLTFIRDCLTPQLQPGDIVLMDNVNFHKSEAIQACIESVGAKLWFLPPYSPDFSPIENMWSKIKSTLRKLAPRTEQQFKKAIAVAFKSITQNDLVGWFKHCGYKVTTV